jgi:hypothetical protein
MRKLVILELNEVNFEFVEKYVAAGKLPNFRRLFDRYGYAETKSESKYEELEPWIQWVTAHSGLPFAEHKLFRLGDVKDSEITQIWEYLESEFGATVAAVSPMNAVNRTRNSPFFVPDPWTGGKVSGPRPMARLYESISRVVNENASAKVSFRDYVTLLFGLLRYGRIRSYPAFLSYVIGSRSGKWRKALVLDRLLADMFVKGWVAHKPDFATLFVNAAAHIQHHYMFSSAAYSGDARNPNWYIGREYDPLLEVYSLYDRIIGEVMELPETRVMLLTGLHQDPHEQVTYYYRLRKHGEFLNKIGIEFASVEPRMSRDFLIRFDSEEAARKAEAVLSGVKADSDGVGLFEVDNRGADAFVTLSYPNEIGTGFSVSGGHPPIVDFSEDVAFVAIKNGQHNGIGYFLDTGWSEKRDKHQLALTDIFGLTVEAVKNAR